ncbi:MAG: DUF4143 domain-containing protein [Acidimicrobiaceae bacterium]|nr:DUF4143 domain-containing protein [Acidimicrobiaceae bacterium]
MSIVLPTPGYLPRIAEADIARGLQTMGAVVVEGPRACGKTWSARQFAASEVMLDGSDEQQLTFALNPESILQGEPPRLLDEWHMVPGTWNAVRRVCDSQSTKGLFLLTGSAVPPDEITRHSGAGRVRRVQMKPLTFSESSRSTNEVSLEALFKGEAVTAGKPQTDFRELVDSAVIGGWPSLLDASVEDAQDYLISYLDEIARTDVALVDSVQRDPIGVSRLLRSLARNVASEAGHLTLAKDAQLNRETVKAYLRALERLFIVENIPAWQPTLMSHVPMRQAPKRYFVDPSLATAALETSSSRLMSDTNYFGLLFENLVVRDLSVYATMHRCAVHHYRDKGGLEVDAIVEKRADGS